MSHPRTNPTCADADSSPGCADPIVSRLCALHHTLMRVADRVLAPAGLTASRLILLKRVEVEDEGRTISWLSEQLSLSVQAVSRMVGTLEDDGLIVRRTRMGAGRSVFVELTDAGRSALEVANEELARVSSSIRGGLSGNDERKIERLLDRMLESLQECEFEPESAEVRG